MDFISDPIEIEKQSFGIIAEQLKERNIDTQNSNIIKRVIHTTADFDYVDNLYFSPDAVRIAKEILSGGANIITDTKMAKAGVNKKSLAELNCNINCFIDSDVVSVLAKDKSTTRASAAVDYAIENIGGSLVFVVGNAPTALIRLCEIIQEKHIKPAFVIGVPVGFVNVVEAKELLISLSIPCIVAKGRKGGSNVAAAICNALIYEILNRRI